MLYLDKISMRKYLVNISIMTDEFIKMRNQEYANSCSAEILERLTEAKHKLRDFNQTYCNGPGYRYALEKLIPLIPLNSKINPPFFCDYGDGIILGENVFINMNCTFLDGAYIYIGSNTLIGPNVQIYTPHHPMDYKERRTGLEIAYPVRIGEDCWIGGGVIICPGVNIGDRVVIGAGSVVTRDIPDDSIVAGNPARPIKSNRK